MKPPVPDPSLTDLLKASAATFAPALASTAAARGLVVTKPDGSTVPIPIAATPVVVSAATLEERRRLSALVSSAGLKMARAALADGVLGPPLVASLSPLEAALATSTAPHVTTLATTRVDFFVDDQGARALELNATIPAMQGYSDIAVGAFLDVVGGHAGVDATTIARWKDASAQNARALHAALLAGYARARPHRGPTRIGLLCRRNDAQLGELMFLRDRFRALGTDAEVIHPDQLAGTDDALHVDGAVVDLVYRHLFVRRLEEPGCVGVDAVRRLLEDVDGTRAVVLNPPASHVELKAIFALLSRAVDDDALAEGAGLTEAERAAARASIPWTRMLVDPALRDAVRDDPDAWVIKRSWDYGGRAVFVGRARDDDSFGARVEAAWPGAARDWGSVCAHAEQDTRGGGFVVQRFVEAPTARHTLCAAGGATEVDLHVDFSTYASVGLDDAAQPPVWGGVCRGSLSSIVNIMGGGGVVPLLTDDVAAELTRALRRRSP